MHRRTNTISRGQRGFTMIELLFAMSFVSVLLIIILTSTLSVTRIYDKGITLKQVDQAGAAIGSELETSIQAANAPLNVSALSKGRLCLGTYSYVWNTPDIAPQNTLNNGGAIGMVKVSDSGSTMCTPPYGPPQAGEAHELLLGANGTGGNSLELRDFSVTQTANSGSNYLYDVNYTVSTNDGSLIANDKCTGGAGDEFCALNSFEFTVFAKQGGDGSVS